MWLTTDELNFVPAFAPRTVTGGAAMTTSFPCKVVNMGRYDSMVAIISMYDPSTEQVWVVNYDSLTPTLCGSVTADTTGSCLNLPSIYIKGTTTDPIDTKGDRTALASTGLTLSSVTSGWLNYYVEIKSSDLYPSIGPYVAIGISTENDSAVHYCVNYVMKPRYPQLDHWTALS